MVITSLLYILPTLTASKTIILDTTPPINNMKITNLTNCLLLLTLLASACRKEAINAAPENQNQSILGRWQWLSASGGFSGGGTHPYPEAKGQLIETEFRPDGQYLEYVSGRVRRETSFQIQEVKSIYDGQQREAVRYGSQGYGGGVITQIIQLKGDTLYLKDNVYDGYTWVYIRK